MKSPFYPTKINGLHRSENSQHINCCLLGKKATLLLKQTSLEGSNLEKKKQKTQKQTNKQKKNKKDKIVIVYIFGMITGAYNYA